MCTLLSSMVRRLTRCQSDRSARSAEAIATSQESLPELPPNNDTGLRVHRFVADPQ